MFGIVVFREQRGVQKQMQHVHLHSTTSPHPLTTTMRRPPLCVPTSLTSFRARLASVLATWSVKGFLLAVHSERLCNTCQRKSRGSASPPLPTLHPPLPSLHPPLSSPQSPHCTSPCPLLPSPCTPLPYPTHPSLHRYHPSFHPTHTSLHPNPHTLPCPTHPTHTCRTS